MNGRIKTWHRTGRHVQYYSIFGYRSRGVPGLQIMGLGKQDLLLKEKIIYLTRRAQVSIPFGRYVLCLEGSLEKKNIERDYFELPFLILYLFLSRNLSLRRIEGCLCRGKISLQEGLVFDSLPDELCPERSFQLEKSSRGDRSLPLSDILSEKLVKEFLNY